jgi:hypothetical protein
MEWTKVTKKGKSYVETQGEMPDPFWAMTRQDGTPTAEISIEVSRAVAIDSNEWVKCAATIRIKCPQSETFIDMASELSYKKALEIVNDGMSHLSDVPPILMK